MIEGEHGGMTMKGLLNYDEVRGRSRLVFDNVMNAWLVTTYLGKPPVILAYCETSSQRFLA